ncbi:MAG: DUF3775 domain-containing protein [Hyphomicrobiales bacterium]|nr:DUF3775 domain-containing protein [Hyphomicrobiales bacterium]
MIAQKARAAAAMMDDTFEDGHEGDIDFDDDTLSDSHSHSGLHEEEDDDLSREELVELIADLNVDEAAALVAVVWIGRGDFDATDWSMAVEEARGRAVGPTSRYLIGMPMLADHIESGLDALGV